jgi:hypothetical protein
LAEVQNLFLATRIKSHSIIAGGDTISLTSKSVAAYVSCTENKPYTLFFYQHPFGIWTSNTLQGGFDMKMWIVKSFMRVFVFLFIMGLIVSSAWAAIINVNQDTFVLSDEAPGHLISRLVNAGYGNYNLYDTLVAIQADTNPSVAGIITPTFLAALQNAPAGAQIFTMLLKNIPTGASIGISTDGTVRTVNIYAYSFYNKTGTSTLFSNISGVGNAYFVHSNDQNTPLTSLTVDGPLPGMTTTYNPFAIASGSVTAAVAIPTLNEWGMIVFTLLIGLSSIYYLRRQKKADR